MSAGSPRALSQGERGGDPTDPSKLSRPDEQLDAEEREAYEVFELGNFALQSGRTLRNAKLAYKYSFAH